MIDKKYLNNFSEFAALWCRSDMENAELALVADQISANNVPLVSLLPEQVGVIWPWLENMDVKIMPRFFIQDKKITEKNISELTIQINNVLKRGASGAQVFLPYKLLADLVEQTYVVRDDLFFDKDLAIGINLYDVAPLDWSELYQQLRKINASSLILVLGAKDAQKNDFVGRIFAMLDLWEQDNNFDLQFVFGGNLYCMESTLRLVQKMRPDLIDRIRFFVNA